MIGKSSNISAYYKKPRISDIKSSVITVINVDKQCLFQDEPMPLQSIYHRFTGKKGYKTYQKKILKYTQTSTVTFNSKFTSNVKTLIQCGLPFVKNNSVEFGAALQLCLTKTKTNSEETTTDIGVQYTCDEDRKYQMGWNIRKKQFILNFQSQLKIQFKHSFEQDRIKKFLSEQFPNVQIESIESDEAVVLINGTIKGNTAYDIQSFVRKIE